MCLWFSLYRVKGGEWRDSVLKTGEGWLPTCSWLTRLRLTSCRMSTLSSQQTVGEQHAAFWKKRATIFNWRASCDCHCPNGSSSSSEHFVTVYDQCTTYCTFFNRNILHFGRRELLLSIAWVVTLEQRIIWASSNIQLEADLIGKECEPTLPSKILFMKFLQIFIHES